MNPFSFRAEAHPSDDLFDNRTYVLYNRDTGGWYALHGAGQRTCRRLTQLQGGTPAQTVVHITGSRPQYTPRDEM